MEKPFSGTRLAFQKPKIDFPWGINNARVLLDDEQATERSIDCEEAQSAGTVIPATKPGERGLCESEVGDAILGRGQHISALARMLTLFADRPVVDKTTLTGGFDFERSAVEVGPSIVVVTFTFSASAIPDRSR